eukprot:6210688-Pleurochrysis_carterae.AAC.1
MLLLAPSQYAGDREGCKMTAGLSHWSKVNIYSFEQKQTNDDNNYTQSWVQTAFVKVHLGTTVLCKGRKIPTFILARRKTVMRMYLTDPPGTNCAVQLSPPLLFHLQLHPELTHRSMSAIHQSKYWLAIFPVYNLSEGPCYYMLTRVFAALCSNQSSALLDPQRYRSRGGGYRRAYMQHESSRAAEASADAAREGVGPAGTT